MDNRKSTCPQCGRKLDYKISPFMRPEVRICKCGQCHYVDDAPVDWQAVNRRDCQYCRFYGSRHDMGFHGVCEKCLEEAAKGGGNGKYFEDGGQNDSTNAKH